MKKAKRKARFPAYKAGPRDREAFQKREAEYRRDHTYFIPVAYAPDFAASKRLFRSRGGLCGDWQMIKKVGPVYVVRSGSADAVAAYDYDAEIWALARDYPEAAAIAALLPPGVCQVWGGLSFVGSVACRGFAATAAARMTQGEEGSQCSN